MNNVIKFTPGAQIIITDKIYAPDFDLHPGDVVEFIKSEPYSGDIYKEEYPNSALIAVYLKLIQCDESWGVCGEVGWFCADELTGELLSC